MWAQWAQCSSTPRGPVERECCQAFCSLALRQYKINKGDHMTTWPFCLCGTESHRALSGSFCLWFWSCLATSDWITRHVNAGREKIRPALLWKDLGEMWFWCLLQPLATSSGAEHAFVLQGWCPVLWKGLPGTLWGEMWGMSPIYHRESPGGKWQTGSLTATAIFLSGPQKHTRWGPFPASSIFFYLWRKKIVAGDCLWELRCCTLLKGSRGN